MELGKDLNHIIKRENMLEKQFNAEFEKTEQLYLALLLISHTKMEFATPEVLMLGLCLMSEGGGRGSLCIFVGMYYRKLPWCSWQAAKGGLSNIASIHTT